MSDFLFVLLIVALAFIMKGEPSLWDVWHDRLVHAAECRK